ncbi:thioredoxin family protein [Archangium lansingense]|uniref:Thioredoxin family protein n=1 Tax=Archangium lansingense TaxID=2995310 RepID=A0ABT4A2A9_9BACT|nr:thioredoxin family protein [Archangium lansinium]MCY1075783.1 thioredoxin family protein [Archangium lansinium]
MPTFLRVFLIAAIAAVSIVLAWSSARADEARLATLTTAPDFSGGGEWINSPLLRMSQLRGKVVLVEFWTYSCINCLRVAPYVSQWHARYADQGLVVVGVHTPEYGYERVGANVREAVRRLDIQHPVVQDNGYRIWNAYGNQYWPALYLIDREGRVVYRHFGEGAYDRTEAQIRALLAAR